MYYTVWYFRKGYVKIALASIHCNWPAPGGLSFHCAALRRNSSFQDSSSSMAWSRNGSCRNDGMFLAHLIDMNSSLLALSSSWWSSGCMWRCFSVGRPGNGYTVEPVSLVSLGNMLVGGWEGASWPLAPGLISKPGKICFYYIFKDYRNRVILLVTWNIYEHEHLICMKPYTE